MKGTKVFVSIFILIVIICLSNQVNEVNEVKNDVIPRKSEYLNVSPIYINGSSEWAILNSTHEWCNGAGTKEDPYIIENIKINGGIANNCIYICNSNVDFTIRNCSLFNASIASINFKNVSNGRVEKNIIFNNPGAGVSLDSCLNNTILNNTIYNNGYMGIRTSYCNDTKILNNNISNSFFGIYIWKDTYNTILENSLLNNANDGLYLRESNFANITCNIANNNTNSMGIFLSFCNNATVIENEACYNRIGIYSRGESIYAALNNLRNNEYGLIPSQSYYSTYYKNLIIDNIYGIHVYTDTNTFYYNYLDNIERNVYEDLSGSNKWDNGSIGNYYSNYTGVDLNGDGIGDDPYYIPGRSGYVHGPDNYPIVWQNPLLSVLEPLEGAVYSVEAPSFNLLILRDKIVSMWYTINNNKTKFYFSSNTTILQSAWDLLLDGSVSINFHIKDIQFGLTKPTQVTIFKDTTGPIINVVSPITSEVFELPPSYEITITEVNLDKIWYTLDGYANKIFITELIGNISASLWNQLPNGNITIRFYANDTQGYIGFSEVTIVRNVPTPTVPQEIPGYNLIILIGITILITISTLKFKYNTKTSK